MMSMQEGRNPSQGFETLRQFVRKPRRNVEQCELCSAELAAEHSHLIELNERKILCACEACALLFSSRAGSKFKRVPRDARRMADFQMTDAEWDGLLIPINLAFFFQNSLSQRVTALYPSPAGATESLLPLEAWNQIVQSNPVLASMEPDVEALLVNRVGSARQAGSAEYYVVPIDACYRLVGLIRMHWRGLSGGSEVWEKVGEFFAQLRSKAEVVGEELHA
ncbi:MAG TPA: DUF5947 family protein [Verrucomicrobiae bacterium]|jgi:hypothetical protein|nr:DUF5947 family protein [Verrucomicrobiae bacterium]